MSSIVVVGAGAAGLMAAIFAAERAPVTMIERTSDGGRKILISGGGRCNVLPALLEPERFVSDSPSHLVRAFLKSWPLDEQRAFFERDAGIPLTLEPATGKIFPVSGRARDVRDALVAVAQRRGVRFMFDTTLTAATPKDTGWTLETTTGPLTTSTVVLATGGLSVPATGSDGAGIQLAQALGHALHDTYPALTPLVGDGSTASLSGISLTVRIRARRSGRTTQSRGGFLFTHRGYSGPSVLDLSHVPVRSRLAGDSPHQRASLRVSWSELNGEEWEALLRRQSPRVLNVVAERLPLRLARHLLEAAGIPLDRRGAELRRKEATALLDALTSFVLPWTGDEGYKKAEVTGGGIALDQVDPVTMESRHHPGFFLCGEMLDAFGPIGGHNFAWAWATGRAAGLGAAERYLYKLKSSD